MTIRWADKLISRIPFDLGTIAFVYYETDLVWRASDYTGPFYHLLLSSLDDLDQDSELLLNGYGVGAVLRLNGAT